MGDLNACFHHKNNTLYVERNPDVLLKLQGDIVVFYSSILDNTLPSLISNTNNNSNINSIANKTVVTTQEGRRFMLIDVSTNKSFSVGDFKDYDKMFIVNIDFMDYALVLELLTPVFMTHETHANTIGGRSLKRLLPMFTHINY